MDPLSIIASIGSVCGTAVKLITTISEFVDSVNDAPKEVQALNSQLAGQYASLGQLKIAVSEPRVSKIDESWLESFEKVIFDCKDTLEAVGKIVEKSKITQVSGSSSQIFMSVKFTFQAATVRKLKARVHGQTSLLTNLFAALNESRGKHLEQRLEDIHGLVDELLSSRRTFKETIAIVSTDENDEAEVVIHDRRKPTKTSDGTAASPIDNTSSSESAIPDDYQWLNPDTSSGAPPFTALLERLNVPTSVQDQLRAAHSAELSDALAQARQESLSELELELSKADQKHEERLEALRNQLLQTHEEAMETMAKEMEAQAAAQVEQATSALLRLHEEELAVLRAEVEDSKRLEMDLAVAKSQVEDLRQVESRLGSELSKLQNGDLLSQRSKDAVLLASRESWTVSELKLRATQAARGNSLPDLSFNNMKIKIRLDRVLWIEQTPRTLAYMSTWFTGTYKASREGSKVSITGTFRPGLGNYGKSQYDCFLTFTSVQGKSDVPAEPISLGF